MKRSALYLLFLAVCAVPVTAVPASANTFTYQGDSTVVPPGGDSSSGAGAHTFTFAYDDVTDVLDLSITFQQNAAGFVANLFFFTITDGPMPAPGTQTTVFFDASHADVRVSGYENVAFDGNTEPVINAAAGDLLFSTLLAPGPVLGATATPGLGSVTYTLSLDGSGLPGLSFGTSIGIWLQSMGLYQQFGLFSTYDANSGRLTALEADAGSPAGYGWYDVPHAPTEVPEPFTATLLGTGLAALALRRKKAA